jgi:hypothetical protein
VRALVSHTVVSVCVGVFAAATVFAGSFIALTLLGGTECDRGECNWLGEFIDEHPAFVATSVIVTAAMSGFAAGFAVWRAARSAD